jgi:hypothetical protein
LEDARHEEGPECASEQDGPNIRLPQVLKHIEDGLLPDRTVTPEEHSHFLQQLPLEIRYSDASGH